MRNILFIDRLSPRPYTLETLKTTGAGASDSYLVYLAKALTEAARHPCHVWIAHGTRNSVEHSATHPITYLPLRGRNIPRNMDAVIVQRDPELVKWAKAEFPHAKVILWMSDFAEKSRLVHTPVSELAALDVEIVGLSRWHADNLRAFFGRLGLQKRIDYLYYPVDAKPQAEVAVDPNKLVFFSSPHKGIRTTLRAFLAVLEHIPSMRLFVGNPGYVDLDLDGFDNRVVPLGSLSRSQVLHHVQEALCVFHLNDVYPETFGAIHAEANAVGTPVLTFDTGANREVLSCPDDQLMMSTNVDAIARRVVAWREGGRPVVSTSPMFKPRAIAHQWISVLKGVAVNAPVQASHSSNVHSRVSMV